MITFPLPYVSLKPEKIHVPAESSLELLNSLPGHVFSWRKKTRKNRDETALQH